VVAAVQRRRLNNRWDDAAITCPHPSVGVLTLAPTHIRRHRYPRVDETTRPVNCGCGTSGSSTAMSTATGGVNSGAE
jgi:hypothetical protein